MSRNQTNVLIFIFYLNFQQNSVVILKSGLVLGLGLGRKLYVPVFLELLPTTKGGSSGFLGRLSIVGGDRM